VKIGVVGAGAIGLTLAAGLSRANDVLVLAHRPEAAELLNESGIVVEREGAAQTVRIRASVDPLDQAGREAVILAVKSPATADALLPLRGVLGADALIASVQNGIGNVAAARTALPTARIVAGSTTQGATRLGDNRVRQVNDGTTTFGNDTAGSPSSADLAAAFAEAGLDARVADDIETVLWRKLVANAAINTPCALSRRTNGAVLDDPDLRAVAAALAEETAAVARAEGIDVTDGWAVAEAAARASAANRNSMLQDLDAGRPTEIETIAGVVVSRAAFRGLAVPATTLMLHLVRARQRAAAERRSDS
jgi:2-dehydropantoate 2-reductase